MRTDISPTAQVAPEVRYRALFYVFDGGSGIGHLRRLSRIAAAMQDRFSCLIVTGHDVGPQWIVPPECEYVHLPSWDKLIPGKAAYWGRKPFVDMPLKEAVAFRRAILDGIIEGFRPDVLVVDHLPLGAHAEIAPLVHSGKYCKYLVTRGIQNESEDLQRLVLGGDALDSLKKDYTRIFSAIDQHIFDFASSYPFSPEVLQKINATGYVASPPMNDVRARTRAARGLDDDTLWVVASAGSGQGGEELIEACLALTAAHPTVHFDIAIGPRSRLAPPHNTIDLLDGGRIRVHSSCAELSDFHASADLVVTTGGYNSLLEILHGSARILCVPYRKDPQDEPIRHALCLKRYVDLEVDADLARFPELFAAAIQACGLGPVRDRRREIDMDGAIQIAKIVFDDVSAAKALNDQ